MRNGFIFNHDKCVSCNACSAACILENGWTVHPRNIYTYNAEAGNLLPVINLSLACNHCESAICMDGCPSAVFSRDKATGAILIDDTKCIGCKYCQWNCPYDAPKYDYSKNTISKCNLCFQALKEGRMPACSIACPTGALKFGELKQASTVKYSWFPDKKLIPAIEFTARNISAPLKVIPEALSDSPAQLQNKKGKSISGEFSLVVFSFLATISVTLLISSFIKGLFPEKLLFIAVLAGSGIASIFHLGKKLRSWRAVMNLRSSPLSREIAVYILYSLISIIAVLMRIPFLLVASSVSGLVLLLSIDNVYIYTERKRNVILHSGQTFITALLIVSFLTGNVLPFIFISLVKVVLSGYNYLNGRTMRTDSAFRFLRITFLVVPGLSLILNHSQPDTLIIIILLTGELIDRILYYIDFNPININNMIWEQTNI